MIDALRHALSSGSIAALPLMLAGGVLAGLNPCFIALYPAAAAACCGTRGRDTRQAVTGALGFAIGLAMAISLLGMAAAVAGRLVTVMTPFRYAIAFVPLVMGVHLLGLVKFPIPSFAAGGCRMGGALGTGFLFSLVIGPCSTPFFASALSYSAYSRNIAYGALLLFMYGLGAGTPIVFAGGSIGRIAQRLDRAGYQVWVNRLTGAALLAFGFYLIWNV